MVTMTSKEGHRLAEALATDEAVRTLGVWRLEQDERTRAIYYHNTETGVSVFCTPCWEADGNVEPYLAVERISNEGDMLSGKQVPFDGTRDSFVKVMSAELSR
jgi:hypothetical protein